MVSLARKVDVDMAGDDGDEEVVDDNDGQSDDVDDGDDESESDIPDDEVDDDDEEEKEEEETEVKSGWADAMAKVLNTGKTSKSSAALLSKAKKDYERVGVKAKGDEAAECDNDAAGGGGEKRESYAVKRARKKEKDAVGRVKPDVVADRARERLLAKLATKGVVQLFNAVREQQKSLKSQLDVAGRSARKREKVFKNIDREGFLDVLTGGKKVLLTRKATKSGQQQQQECKAEVAKKEEEEEDESTWKILRDDFMMGAKMRDWDKDSDSEGQ